MLNGRYRLFEPLGKGGMASVYRAHDTNLDIERAVKVLDPKLLRSSEARKRFTREARLLARLDHPNVVAVHDVGAVGSVPYLVLDLVRGESLATILRQGPMSPRHAATLVAELLSGLGVCHEAGLVHRDLSLGNVLVTERGSPVIVDFGIAKAAGETGMYTHYTKGMGTPAFIAPEQQRDARTADARSDLYSVGVLLFAMVSGGAPGFHQALDSVPVPLAAVIRHATRSKPERRYPTAEAMRTAVLEAMDELQDAFEVDGEVDGGPATPTGVTLGAFLTRYDLTRFREGANHWHLGRIALGLLVAAFALLLIPGAVTDKVPVVITSIPAAAWRLEGDATRSGPSTPFAASLEPGHYTLTLVSAQGQERTLELEIEGDEDAVRRCWSFETTSPCP